MTKYKLMYQADWKKYFYVFVITLAIFATAFFTSGKLNNVKIDELRSIQDNISVDLLSSEMQFSLLAESSCEEAASSPISEELTNLGRKLSYATEGINTDEAELLWLKKNYSLFEIRDYLLMKKVAERCKTKPIFALYFYSNEGDCPDCEKQGLVLTRLREKYPGFRVYSFDYNLDLSAQETLMEIHKVKNDLPALLMNNKVYYGLKDEEEMLSLLPDLLKLSATSTEEKL